MKEWYVKYWGEASNFLRERLNVDNLDFWFETEKEVKNHINYINGLCENVGVIVHAVYFGEDVRYKTIADMDLVSEIGNYHLSYDFGYGYPCSSAEFMFFQGNYACDCNLSNFIRRVLGVFDFPEMGCGDKIKIENFKIIKEK